MKAQAVLACAAALASILAGPARPATMQCDIVVRSQAGGEIEVISGQEAAGAPRLAPPLVLWRPTASSGRARLWVSYQGSPLTGLGEPTGVHLSFAIPEKTAADSATVSIRSANGRNWRFVGQGLERGDDDAAYIEFGEDLVYGRALLGALADGQDLTVSVERYDSVSGATQFGSANLRARDALLAQARRKFEAADPTMCGVR